VQDLPPPDDKASRRKRIITLVALLGLALFMYVSFILKTAIKGP
jgi:hypothetical protein